MVEFDEILQLRKKVDELTEKLQLTESRLESNESRIRTVVQALPVGLLITDHEGRIEALNPHCLKIFRSDYADLASRKIGELLHISNQIDLLNPNISTFENVQSLEIKAVRPNGQNFPAEITLRSFKTPNGQKFVVVIEDVTERHEIKKILDLAKQRLERSEKRLMIMIANMPVGLAIVSRDGIIEFSNPAMQKMFCRKDFLAEQLQDVLSIGRKQLLDILAGKQAAECETVQAFGTPITIEVSATDITMLDEEKYLIILQDVTSRHQLQRLRKDFVAMITHDLRTPLTSIDLSTFLIEEGLVRTGMPIPEVVMESVQSTRRSSSRLLGLVNDLLDYEKLESRSFTLNFARTSVSAIVEQSVIEVQPIASERQITISLPVHNFEFQADESRIVQVIVNLLSNAIKFSPDGSNISIDAACRNEQIEFRIIDNGRGIPDDLKQVVFERYKQINKEDGQRGKGTGLGLPICKALVEGHGGEIGVFDNPKQGCTFWFRLPQKR